MKYQKKLLPVWLIILIDLFMIAAYSLSFYGLYYLVPRQLESNGVRTIPQKTVSASQNNESAASEESFINSSEVTAETTTEASEESTAETGEITEAAETGEITEAAGTVESDRLASKFVDKFTDTVVSTDHTYSSKNISITVDQYTEGSGQNIITYYVADIYIADIESFQSGFADDTYGIGYTERVLSMDGFLNAVLAMNGDYYGNGGNGVVIRNGEVYRNSTSNLDVCVLYYDGTMKTFSPKEFDVEQVIADGAWQAWSFGPELLDDTGSSKTDFNTDGHVRNTNPRSAIGYYEPGHYCFVVVDGRQNGYSVGLNIIELSKLFEELGCTSAYNMDGGRSSEMTFNDATVNRPCDGGREVSDCILIKEVE